MQRPLLILVFALAAAFRGDAADKLPPKPDRYFNDYAEVISAQTERALNERLEAFERETSNQIVVAIFRRFESDSSIADYTWRIAESWKVGQQDKRNGAVLFVFIDARKAWIQVGYGLEGALPDAICKRIYEEEIKPHFRAGNYDAGITAGVNAMIQATRGEYQGTGRTAGQRRDGSPGRLFMPLVFALVIMAFMLRAASSRGTSYSRRGRRRGIAAPWFIPMGGGGSWGGSSGGSSWGGGGGFTGGGGSFGGGGAGGDW